MSFANILVWLCIIIIFCASIYWHIKENKRIVTAYKSAGKHADQWLIRFAWARSIQLLLAIALGFFMILYYSIELNRARDGMATMAEQLAALSEQAAATAPSASTLADAVKMPAAAEAAPPAHARKSALDDVFRPDEGGDGQSAIDALKQRYEDVLVIYFFLTKCHKAKQEDYYVIMSALSHDMASANAPGRLQHDVLTSAQGSFTEIYSESPCSTAETDALLPQYNAYIAGLSRYTSVP